MTKIGIRSNKDHYFLLIPYERKLSHVQKQNYVQTSTTNLPNRNRDKKKIQVNLMTVISF